MSETPDEPMSDLEMACYDMILEMAVEFPAHEKRILGDDPKATARIWATELKLEFVPVSFLPDLKRRAQARMRREGTTGIAPNHQDLLLAWDAHRDEIVAEKEAKDWKDFNEDRQAPPVVLSLVAPPALKGFFNRSDAVVCHCKLKDGADRPARLSADGTHWDCGQIGAAGACGFYLKAEKTAEAPLPEFTYAGATRRPPGVPAEEPESSELVPAGPPDVFDDRWD